MVPKLQIRQLALGDLVAYIGEDALVLSQRLEEQRKINSYYKEK